MNVNIALLTVTDTRTLDTDKSGRILVEKIKSIYTVVETYVNQFDVDGVEGLSEDEVKDSEEFIQKLTDTFTKKVDDLVAVKEVDIMKV